MSTKLGSKVNIQNEKKITVYKFNKADKVSEHYTIYRKITFLLVNCLTSLNTFLLTFFSYILFGNLCQHLQNRVTVFYRENRKIFTFSSNMADENMFTIIDDLEKFQIYNLFYW